MDAAFVNESEIEAGLPHVLASPKDDGKVEAIFLRPKEGERASPESVYLSPEYGVQGDRWASTSGRRLPDGKPYPSTQVSLMNARVLDLLAGTREKWPLAGDNLIVDLDLSGENVPAGQRLAIDDVLLEVTDVPHTGCRTIRSGGVGIRQCGGLRGPASAGGLRAGPEGGERESGQRDP